MSDFSITSDGEGPGHEFRGNQYTGSRGGAGYFEQKAISYAEGQSPASRETLMHIAPNDFLAIAKQGHDPNKENRVSTMIRNGEKFDSLPVLLVDRQADGSYKASGHEGRHRARALAAAGEATMPVIIKVRDSQYGTLRWGQYNHPHPTHLVPEEGGKPVKLPGSHNYPPRSITADGEGTGHEFHGNQHTGGRGGSHEDTSLSVEQMNRLGAGRHDEVTAPPAEIKGEVHEIRRHVGINSDDNDHLGVKGILDVSLDSARDSAKKSGAFTQNGLHAAYKWILTGVHKAFAHDSANSITSDAHHTGWFYAELDGFDVRAAYTEDGLYVKIRFEDGTTTMMGREEFDFAARER